MPRSDIFASGCSHDFVPAVFGQAEYVLLLHWYSPSVISAHGLASIHFDQVQPRGAGVPKADILGHTKDGYLRRCYAGIAENAQ